MPRTISPKHGSRFSSRMQLKSLASLRSHLWWVGVSSPYRPSHAWKRRARLFLVMARLQNHRFRIPVKLLPLRRVLSVAVSLSMPLMKPAQPRCGIASMPTEKDPATAATTPQPETTVAAPQQTSDHLSNRVSTPFTSVGKMNEDVSMTIIPW